MQRCALHFLGCGILYSYVKRIFFIPRVTWAKSHGDLT